MSSVYGVSLGACMSCHLDLSSVPQNESEPFFDGVVLAEKLREKAGIEACVFLVHPNSNLEERAQHQEKFAIKQ